MSELSDKPRMTDKEFAVALAELTALGLVEWRDDDYLKLSDKGLTYVFELEQRLSPRDRLALDLLYEEAMEALKDEDT